MTDELLDGEKLEIKYVPIDKVVLWNDNAKLHDIGGIIRSISRYGFSDPSKYDAKLEALVEGNGRAEALLTMYKDNMPIPRGILIDDNGMWYMPIVFGVDAKSISIAKQYAVDHNNLTMIGGDFTPFDVAKMWDTDGYKKILANMLNDEQSPISLDFDDIRLLLTDIDENNSDNDDEVIGDTITITFKNPLAKDTIIKTIGVIFDRNPQWEAQIKGG